MEVISTIALIPVTLSLAYWLLLALASIRMRVAPAHRTPTHRFAIALPAHDEASVIGVTVQRLLALDYPRSLFSVHIVADHCTDQTAEIARAAGAVVHERDSGPRNGKGGALSWLFARILDGPDACDAVVIFDADTQVAPDFLRIMDAHLAEGRQVIQGQHIISNPNAGWFPALTWAMFIVDNRYQNLGRTNLNLSAKHMGDSICFRADILRRLGWGEGLTEDYQLRQRLLLEGIKIYYEPAARGYGEAALSWTQARAQRARWLRGAHDSGKIFARELLIKGLRKRDMALLDGGLQVYLPSFSTLTMISGFLLTMKLLLVGLNAFDRMELIVIWAVIVALLFLYPLFGLALEKAPLKAYLAILSGPIFIIWRTWLALSVRFGKRKVTWVRTAHGEQRESG